MSVVALLVFGIAAGFLATKIMRLNVDVPTTIAIGIGGALIGWLLLQALAAMAGMLAGFVGAVMGALALIWVYKTYFAKKP
jgi:uncharacterized membrane protein YeaQ/YmgE (transglycosylase-associated protein family)